VLAAAEVVEAPPDAVVAAPPEAELAAPGTEVVALPVAVAGPLLDVEHAVSANNPAVSVETAIVEPRTLLLVMVFPLVGGGAPTWIV
jgi:hypothetical protein